MMALPFAFGGCEKDPEQPDNNTPQKTEEFIYNANLYFWRPGSSNQNSNVQSVLHNKLKIELLQIQY